MAGRLATRIAGAEGSLGPGEEATVPAGVPHDWWNAGDEVASVLVELTAARPALSRP